MEPSQLILGKAYYRLIFADPGLTIPAVQPLAFVDFVQVIDTEDNESLGYAFQDAVSFLRSGILLEEVIVMTESELRSSSFYSLEAISDEILAVLKRVKAQGEPTR